jgi:hypothetical protein
MDRRKLGISLLIVLVIGLHAAPVVFYQGGAQTYWPFLAWAMYKNSRPPGPIQARRTRLVGITADGTEHRIGTRDVGLPRHVVRDFFTDSLRGNNAALAQQFMRRLNRHRKDPFVEVRVVGQVFSLTPTGIVIRDNPVIRFVADSSTSNVGASQ